MRRTKLTKEDIINTAFIEWGRKNFISRSLTLITRKLNITKPALYRYFRNKDELIECMKLHLIDRLYNDHKQLTAGLGGKTPDEKIYSIIKGSFSFFIKNHYYLMFYLFYLLKRDFLGNEKFIEMNEDLDMIVKDILAKSKTWINPEESGLALTFIFSTGIFRPHQLFE